MKKKLDKALSAAVLRLMRPLVRILLRNGMAYGNLAELVRKAYVDVAWREFAPEGKKQTVSRVSALTGLTRKEVRRLLDEGMSATAPDQERYNRAIRVISGWVNDRRFRIAMEKLQTFRSRENKNPSRFSSRTTAVIFRRRPCSPCWKRPAVFAW